MQRWLFFIIGTCWLSTALCQPVDMLRVELSLWFTEPNVLVSIPATAHTRVRIPEDADSILFTVNSLIVNTIKISEGRLKQELPFFQTGDSLWVVVKGQAVNNPLSLHFVYDIVPQEPSVQQSDAFIAFNPFNLEESVNLGRAGSFYPARAGDASNLALNITVPTGQNSHARGILNFITDNQDGTFSHFWDSSTPISPEQFYLVIGQFEASEPEDLAGELDFTPLDQNKLRAETIRPRLTPLLTYLQKAATDSVVVYIDSLSDLTMGGFYLTEKDVASLASTEQFNLEKAALLLFNDFDTAEASQVLFGYYTTQGDQSWRNELVESKWQKLRSLSREHQEITTSMRLEQWLQASGFRKNFNTAILDTALLEPMVESLEFPSVSLSYRYISADGAQHIIYRQDTVTAPLYAIPSRVTVITRSDTLRSYHFLNEPEGALKIETPQAPQYVDVDFGEYFPGTVEDNKPETYSLYLLSNANTPEARQEALLRLFKTKNPNLFSTVLGIAMDDDDAALRLEALKNAHDLNVPARQKLKDTLISLAENDSDQTVREEAKKLVQKYYLTQ